MTVHNTGREILKEGGAITVRPGFIVVDVSSATGGIHTSRRLVEEHRVNGGDGAASTHTIERVVDHEAAVALVDAIVKHVDYLCRKHCARAAFGWYATAEGLAALTVEIAKAREDATEINARAAAVGSQRRAYVAIVPAEIKIDNAAAACEIARTVRAVLSDVIEALRSGSVTGRGNRLHAPLQRIKNLEQLAVGPPRDALIFALQRIAPARNEIREALARGESPESAGKAVDLSAIEGAITWFDEESVMTTTDAVEAVDAALAG